MARLFFILVFLWLAACATPQEYSARRVESPISGELEEMSAYVGLWEIDNCINGNQAQRVEFSKTAEGLVLKRWQWKKDVLPLFEVEIKKNKQNTVTYQSKDMHDMNPVLNHSTWSWLDRRIVGSFQWQPDKGDQRGPWMGVALAQFYISKDEPEKLFWNRWGTSHGQNEGLGQWKSSCVYKKVDLKAVLEKKLVTEDIASSFGKKDNVETDLAKNQDMDPEERRVRDLQFLRKGRGLSPEEFHDLIIDQRKQSL